MSSILNADLHCHSVVSDGTLTPEDLARRAHGNGVELWSLTDHDEVGGQQRAADAAQSLGMKYLTGTEISVTFADTTVWSEFWLIQMWLAVLFFVYCAAREMVRVVGKDKIIRMFFGG